MIDLLFDYLDVAQTFRFIYTKKVLDSTFLILLIACKGKKKMIIIKYFFCKFK